jgi:DNA-binding GntR family transcriptional regulator
MSAIQPLERRNLSESIFLSLQASILKGTLRPGDRLRELDLAQQFRTSQAPVREALRRLEQAALVESLASRGTFVKSVTPEEMQEVILLRGVLEAMALRRFVERASPENVGFLQKCVEGMKTAAEAQDLEALVEHDIAFHDHICRASGSATLYAIWSLIHGQARLVTATLNRFYDHGLGEISARHQPIVDAIRAKDLERALRANEQHRHTVWDRIQGELQLPESSASTTALFQEIARDGGAAKRPARRRAD